VENYANKTCSVFLAPQMQRSSPKRSGWLACSYPSVLVFEAAIVLMKKGICLPGWHHVVEPKVFKAMLHLMYTDSLTADMEECTVALLKAASASWVQSAESLLFTVADRCVKFVDAGLEAKGVVGVVTVLNFNLAKLKVGYLT
jgi:hypothetical protein